MACENEPSDFGDTHRRKYSATCYAQYKFCNLPEIKKNTQTAKRPRIKRKRTKATQYITSITIAMEIANLFEF